MSTAVSVQTTPSSWTPEYLAEFHGTPLVIGASCFIAVNTMFVTMRFISRYLQHTHWRVDDGLVLISWLFNVAFCAIEIVHVKVFGAGHHIGWYQYHPELIRGFSIISLYAQPMIYCVAVVAPRMAVLILYLNIFVKKWMRVACWVLGSMMTALMIADIFVIAFMCSPRAKAWDPSLQGHCIEIETFYIWGTFPNFVFDFFMLLLPMPMLWRLHASVRVKVGLGATFAVGSSGIVTSIIRWATYFDNHFVTDDAPWAVNPLEFWMMTEITAYLMCACLVTFRTLLRKVTHTRLVSSMHKFLLRSHTYSYFTKCSRYGSDPGVEKDTIDKPPVSGSPYEVM